MFPRCLRQWLLLRLTPVTVTTHAARRTVLHPRFAQVRLRAVRTHRSPRLLFAAAR